MLASALLASTVLTANASYTAIYGEKQINGDNITFVKKGKWIKASPAISDWTNVGSATGCSNWAPDPSTVAIGTTFNQTANNCTQEQTRTTQNREQNDYTLAFRPIGSPINETQTLTNQTMTRSANGTKVMDECSKDQNTRWVNGTPSFGIMYVMWDNVKVFPDVGNIYLTEYTYNGYKYTKGAQTANLGYYTFHSVCRVPI
jgi:hypothetical protein